MRGPRLEQIDGGDATFRVAIERPDGSKETVESLELMTRHDAHKAAHLVWADVRDDPSVAAVCVVNERTGFTSDRISRG